MVNQVTSALLVEAVGPADPGFLEGFAEAATETPSAEVDLGLPGKLKIQV